MKKIILTTLLLPSLCLASSQNTYKKDTITLLSKDEMAKIMAEPPELRAQMESRKKQMEEKGYIENDNKYASFLLNLKQSAKDEIRAYYGTQFKEDTHLKTQPSEIKLAFEFKKLPIHEKNILGYAPIGTYLKNPVEGWNGIKVFFMDKDTSICAYEFTDLKLSNGGVMMAKENVKNIVGKKPTFLSVEGSDQSGYVYSVTWYDQLKTNRVDCSTEKYQKNTLDKVIALSNKINRR